MQIGPAATIHVTETARPAAAAASGAAFRLPAEPTGAAGTAAATAPARGLDALLALQETAASIGDGATRDREARRHGRDLLEELAALQRALLSGDAGEATLGRLGALLQSMPAAADPALGAVLRSVALRARLELARRGLPDITPGCVPGDAVR